MNMFEFTDDIMYMTRYPFTFLHNILHNKILLYYFCHHYSIILSCIILYTCSIFHVIYNHLRVILIVYYNMF